MTKKITEEKQNQNDFFELIQSMNDRLDRLESQSNTNVRESVIEKSGDLPSITLMKRKIGAGEVLEQNDISVCSPTTAECFSYIQKLRGLK